MTCQEFLRLLNEDAPIGATPAFDHVVACASCRRELARWRALKGELSEMNAEPLPAFLHTRLMAHINAERERQRRWAWSRMPVMRWLAPLAVAGLVALIVGHAVWRAPQVLRPEQSSKPIQPREMKSRDRESESSEARKSSAATSAAAKKAGEEVDTRLYGRERSMRPAAPAPSDATLSFAPEVAEDRSKPADIRLQEEARVERMQRAEESKRIAKEARAAAARDVEDRLGALGYVDTPAGADAVAATSPAAPVSQAPRQAGVERAQEVICLLTPTDRRAESRSIALAAEDAPSPGVAWLFVVLPDGRVSTAEIKPFQDRVSTKDERLDAEREAQVSGQASHEERSAMAATVIKRLHDLSPGRYLLRRAPAEP